jgi:hypothetical protein
VAVALVLRAWISQAHNEFQRIALHRCFRLQCCALSG